VSPFPEVGDVAKKPHLLAVVSFDGCKVNEWTMPWQLPFWTNKKPSNNGDQPKENS
jgi:hypothetical protein